MIHNFLSHLRESESPKQYTRYMAAVSYWWSDIDDWQRVKDLDQQKRGNDMILTMRNRSQIRLQFKDRGKDYGDMLLEFRHDWHKGHSTPGWMEYPDYCDFLIYLVPRKIYRLNYKELYLAWTVFKTDWIKNYICKKPAENENHVTWSVFVPFAVLKNSFVTIDTVNL